MKQKRYAVLDIDKGIVDSKKVILAEFDTLKEAKEWQSKIKVYGDSFSNFIHYPIWDFKGKPNTLEGLKRKYAKVKKVKQVLYSNQPDWVERKVLVGK